MNKFIISILFKNDFFFPRLISLHKKPSLHVLPNLILEFSIKIGRKIERLIRQEKLST